MNGFAFTGSGLPYIPDVSLPPQLQPIPTLPTLPAISTAGLPYIPDVSLPPQLQPVTTSGLPYIPDVSLPEPLQPPIETTTPPGGYGPIELVGDIAKGAAGIIGGAAETVVNLGKSILKNLEVGVGIAGQVGGISAQKKAAQAVELEAEARKLAAEAYKIQTLAQLEQGRAVVPVAAAAPTPVTYITPETGEAEPNYMMYAAIAAVLMIIIFGKK
jgi:hypothetical protein